ncbi:MAG: glycerol-3-phosphate cytidylyltransferase [Candidatus Cloacimonetes bacterium]|nr:glycerol-3-phosphate cytidylyltransferase [Candidatus Cloacimonadota bacterium]
MIKVITYGTYDLFHYGHFRLLKRAKEFGDYLIVGVSTDEFNLIKGKKCVQPYEHRAEILRAIRYVDEVIPENNWEQKIDDIIKHNVNIFVMGSDWKGKFDFLKEYCTVMYLDRTADISTTALKMHMKTMQNKNIK